jgi:hypothetical protein
MEHKPSRILLWTILPALVVGYFDSITPFEMDFTLLYFVPIAAACWYAGLKGGVTLAVLSMGIWYAADKLSLYHYRNRFDLWWDIVTHAGKFGFVVVAVYRNKLYLNNLKRLKNEIEESVVHNARLRNLLPICFRCRTRRDDVQYWQQVEAYVGEQGENQPVNRDCPVCKEQQH